MRNLSPIFITNSRIPRLLEKLTPMDINAITIFFLVFCKGVPDDRLRRHETVHFQQYLETLVIGFLILYYLDYLMAKLRGLDGWDAYLNIRAEREAWENHDDSTYLQTRKRWQWLRKSEYENFPNNYGEDF